jgi:hypothetical protein
MAMEQITWKIYRRLCTICMPSYVCVCTEGRLEPLPFLPPLHSISLSLGIVVPSTGDFSKFCYPLIFIRFKCFFGKVELPNRPAPFMDVCARIFFHPDFEGGWVHWTYRSSCTITAIVATATFRANDWLSLLSRHLLNAIYRRQSNYHVWWTRGEVLWLI